MGHTDYVHMDARNLDAGLTHSRGSTVYPGMKRKDFISTAITAVLRFVSALHPQTNLWFSTAKQRRNGEDYEHN